MKYFEFVICYVAVVIIVVITTATTGIAAVVNIVVAINVAIILLKSLVISVTIVRLKKRPTRWSTYVVVF